MAQFIVTVNKLNQRSSVPSNLPEPNTIVGTVVKGFTFEGTEASDDEVPNKALGKWFKDNSNHFYWGGGVIEVQADTIQPPPFPVDYAKMFDGIGNDGSGIKVCVLDRGLYDHYAFQGKIKTFSDFTVLNGDCQDIFGHGTHVAGVICSNYNHPTTPMVGVAPACELIFGKVIPDSPGDNDIDFIIAGIDWAISQNVKVLNLSIGVKDKFIDILKPAIKRAAAANIIIVAAAGDVAELDDNHVQYPAADFSNCISVAEVSQTYLQQNPSINPSINYLSGYVNYLSTSIPQQKFFQPLRGSSMATSFVSGLIIRILSEWKNEGKDVNAIGKNEIIDELNKFTVNKSELNFFDNSEFKIAKT